MYSSTDAIILKNLNFKESSIISRIFTYEYGKISIIVKGARKSKNNIVSIIESGNIVNCTFYNGKSSLKTIKEISCKKTHDQTRLDLLRYYFSMAIISIIDKSIHEDQELKNLYNLSVHSLDSINIKKIDLDIIFIHFLIHFIDHLGFNILDNIKNKKSEIIEAINMINTCNDLNSINQIPVNLISNIKLILYRYIKNHIIDLNDIQAISMIKNIKNETTTRAN